MLHLEIEFKLNSSWHLTSTVRQTISAIDRYKTRREKAIEENLTAQIAELKGDLSDKLKILWTLPSLQGVCVCGLELLIIQIGCLF